MAALLRESRDELAEEFGSKNEFGVGIQAPAQTIAWTMTLAKEKDPTVIQFWSDMKNGYSEVHNSAVEKGLQKFPPKLQWLRRAFAAFYGKQNTLYYRTGGGQEAINEGAEENVTRILTDGGVLQGDAPSGVYFNAGV